MHIQLTQADWPEAFNKIARYIGRHWPAGKLKLSKSREVTARIFGYSSVYELQNSLLDNVHSCEKTTIEKLVRECLLCATRLCKCDELQMKTLLKSIPWNELSCFGKYDQSTTLSYLFATDEFSTYMERLTAQGIIPEFEFAVSKENKYFSIRTFFKVLNDAACNDPKLYKQIMEGSVEPDYLFSVIPERGWMPIEQVGHNMLLSFGFELLPAGNDQYAIKRVQYHAVYPGLYKRNQLADVMCSIYLGEIIPETIKEGDYAFLFNGKINLGANSRVTIDKQKFILLISEGFSSYKELLDKPFVKDWVINNNEFNIQKEKTYIHPAIVEKETQIDHEKLNMWKKESEQRCLEKIKNRAKEKLEPILEYLFAPSKVVMLEPLCEEKYQFGQKRLCFVEAVELVKGEYPEISIYCENKIIAKKIIDYCEIHSKWNNDLYSIEDIEIIHDICLNQFSQIFSSNIFLEQDSLVTIRPIFSSIFIDLLDAKIDFDSIPKALWHGQNLLQLHAKQYGINDLRKWAEDIKYNDQGYISHGSTHNYAK